MTASARSILALPTVALLAFLACGGEDGDPSDEARVMTGGSAGSAPRGGASGTGGSTGVSGQGGTGNSSGSAGTGAGSSTGGSSGSAGATGGTGGRGGSTGGTPTAGGNATGGTSGGSAGTSAGGNATGGNAGTDATGGTAGTAALGGSGGSGECSDSCPFEHGVPALCKLRFMYGLNFAWQNFAADFGGGDRGIAANQSVIRPQLQQMADSGVNVLRWWVWPNFTGNGVSFDGSGAPTGLSSTTVEDLEAALALMKEYDMYLMPTLFSFDNFKSALPANRSLTGIGVNATQRAALVANVVRPFARAASDSVNADRVIAWDVINEPEWAVTGAGAGGDEAFDPDDTCSPITHAQMSTLLGDVIAGLRAESDAPISIGAAAMKWKNAWKALDQDFYQFHIYDWVNMSWPYSKSPAEYGMDDKPMVMGEFPPQGLTGVNYRSVVDSWYQNGYAGALAWRDASFMVNYNDVKSFADAHACETRY